MVATRSAPTSRKRSANLLIVVAAPLLLLLLLALAAQNLGLVVVMPRFER
jgi:uncharacterized integral membrane protein